MKCKAVITLKKEELDWIQNIIVEEDELGAMKFLVQLDKKVTEFVEPK